MKYFLAIDTGGSKCEVVIATETGKVVGYSRFESVSKDECISGRSRQAMRVAIENALFFAGRFTADVYVVAYFSAKNLEGILNDIEELNGKIRGTLKTSEQKAALEGLALLKSGIVLLSGTGAFVYARNEKKEEVFLDALGPVLGDDGSGYYIGLRALKAALRANWHPRRKTVLRDLLFDYLQIKNDWEAVKISLEVHERALIASLAKFAIEEAERGDSISKEIICDAAKELATNAIDAIDRLNMWSGGYTVLGVGGVIANSNLYWNEVVKNLSEKGGNFLFKLEKTPLVLGMILNAMKEVNGVGDDEMLILKENLVKSFTEFCETNAKWLSLQ